MTQLGKIVILLFCISLCGSALLTSHYLRSEPLDEPGFASELYELAANHFSALRGWDFNRAYQQVSTNVQVEYTPVQFEDMARQRYHGLLRISHMEFGALKTAGNRAEIKAYLVSQRGAITPCRYRFIREDNHWKIEKLEILRRWPDGSRLRGMRL